MPQSRLHQSVCSDYFQPGEIWLKPLPFHQHLLQPPLPQICTMRWTSYNNNFPLLKLELDVKGCFRSNVWVESWGRYYSNLWMIYCTLGSCTVFGLALLDLGKSISIFWVPWNNCCKMQNFSFSEFGFHYTKMIPSYQRCHHRFNMFPWWWLPHTFIKERWRIPKENLYPKCIELVPFHKKALIIPEYLRPSPGRISQISRSEILFHVWVMELDEPRKSCRLVLMWNKLGEKALHFVKMLLTNH